MSDVERSTPDGIRGGDEILLGVRPRAPGRRRAGDAGPGPRLPGRGRRCSAPTTRPRVRVAGRATLCAEPDDLARFDQVFEAFFNARDGLPAAAAGRARRSRPSRQLPLDDGDERRGRARPTRSIRAAASAAEVLRHRDVASLSRGGEAPAGRRCSRPSARAHRCVVRRATSAGTAARSTPRAPCAPACAGWASPPQIEWRRRGEPAAPRRAAGRRERLDERRTPTRCCGWRTA